MSVKELKDFICENYHQSMGFARENSREILEEMDHNYLQQH